jgi:hypothetical protein
MWARPSADRHHVVAMRRYLVPIAGAVLAAALVVGAVAYYISRHSSDPLSRLGVSTKTLSFDRRRWLDHPDEILDRTRGEMANDVVRRILRPGLPRSRVRHLLGAPDFSHRGELDYFVGAGGGEAGGYIRIRFDEAGRVVRAERVESGGF